MRSLEDTWHLIMSKIVSSRSFTVKQSIVHREWHLATHATSVHEFKTYISKLSQARICRCLSSTCCFWLFGWATTPCFPSSFHTRLRPETQQVLGPAHSFSQTLRFHSSRPVFWQIETRCSESLQQSQISETICSKGHHSFTTMFGGE